ncbi:hypothetical protein K0B96_01360 [Horticoccus luteus]|uniref:Uncharacterized protein n=1 Tax=Horticoccus luteus TaxID=2862869 RepID=A0A8F9TWA2_9BACT|nr:hypothetical protein [Horticoccus luteus]QYM79295.1 hypothetical protein K0B96_01360 [Horticoccus luteus]
MKTSLISILAVSAALVVVPFSIEVVGSLLFAAGIVTMLITDYRVTSPAATDSLLARRRSESLRLAA